MLDKAKSPSGPSDGMTAFIALCKIGSFTRRPHSCACHVVLDKNVMTVFFPWRTLHVNGAIARLRHSPTDTHG